MNNKLFDIEEKETNVTLNYSPVQLACIFDNAHFFT